MTGIISREIADAILETISLEMTVIDENDRIVWWNSRRSRIFARPEKVLGTDVRACHSEKSLGTIDTLLREMKSGKRESARMWYDETAGGVTRKLLIEYLALRDESGRYLGCVETLQDVAPFRYLEGERKTLDG